MPKPPERPPARFPTTAWSLVARAGRQSGPASNEDLGQLLSRYLPALRAHLVYRKGLNPEVAEDFVQEFVAGKIVEKGLIGKADQNLGKFRTFLLTALDRFVANQIRDQRAKKRTPGKGMLVSMGEHSDVAECDDRPSDVFDFEWARGVIDQALARMEQQCAESGRADLWGVFEARVVRPSLQGAEPLDYRDLIERFGFKSPTQASNALTTAKRMYARALREVVAEYAAGQGEVEAEIDELQKILARSAR